MGVLQRCEGLDWRVATGPEDVGPALAEHRPEIVFSIKHSGFSGEAHRSALHAPGLTWFHVGGSGREHLGTDLPRGVRLTDCAGVLAPFLAERGMAALLSLTSGLREFGSLQARREWQPTRFRPIAGRTLLVIGAGHTGMALATRARAFGVRVIGLRRSAEPQPGFEEMHGPEAIDRLLPKADIVSLNVRAEAATLNLLDRRRLALLPKGAIVMNAARGAVLDEAGLLDALGDNVAAAWLDVFTVEPLPVESPLWSHPRVLVTPHCADQVTDFPERFARRFAELWAGES